MKKLMWIVSAVVTGYLFVMVSAAGAQEQINKQVFEMAGFGAYPIQTFELTEFNDGSMVLEIFNSRTHKDDTPETIEFTTDVGKVIIRPKFRRGILVDEFFVVPPEGYFASPEQFSIEDFNRAEIKILPYLLG